MALVDSERLTVEWKWKFVYAIELLTWGMYAIQMYDHRASFVVPSAIVYCILVVCQVSRISLKYKQTFASSL